MTARTLTAADVAQIGPREFRVPSRSNPAHTPHTVIRRDDDTLACTCKGSAYRGWCGHAFAVREYIIRANAAREWANDEPVAMTAVLGPRPDPRRAGCRTGLWRRECARQTLNA